MKSIHRVVLFVVGLVPVLQSASSAQTQVVPWGFNNAGQCDIPSPPAGTHWISVAAGNQYTLLLASDGSITGFGYCGAAQCAAPPPLPGTQYVAISAFNVTSAALRSDGTIAVWGSNDWGQFDVPPVPAGVTYVEVSAGWDHMVARRSDGMAVAWGRCTLGACAVPAYTYTQVSAGVGFAAGVRSDGLIAVWGAGLGAAPALPAGLHYVEVDCGSTFALARLSDGAVVGWGYGPHGETSVPALPTGLVYEEIEAGWFTSMARRSDGTVIVWGSSGFGLYDVPSWGPNLTCSQVSLGNVHALALVSGCGSVSTYCTAKINSLGCTPQIGWSGSPKLSDPSDFVVTASAVRNFRSGLMFWGTSEAATPFQGGMLCVAQPIRRTPLQDSGGTTAVEDCSGAFEFEMSADYLFAHGVSAGDELFAQYWSRDPSSAPYWTSLTNALRFSVCP